MNTKQLWQTVLADLEIQVSRAAYQTIISQTKLLNFNDKTALIGCTQPLLMSVMEKKYYQDIKKTLDHYTKTDTQLVFTVIPSETKKSFDGPLFSSKITHEITMSSVGLNPDYTFENFAVSSSNQMAHAAGTAVANTPGVSYNPLFLYGGVGVGKTHLMQAIGHHVIKTNPQTKIIYCTGEDFTNDIIEAIRNKTTVVFKKKYRRVNLLLIDDIQFIAGKNAVQEEFFHTFNALQQVRGQIVMTSDRPPEEINKLEERLKSRFEGGLSIDIGEPDFELRCAILLIKAKQRGINLHIDLAKAVAASVSNPRKLTGVLIRLLTESQTEHRGIDQEMVEKILKKTIIESVRKKSVKPEEAMEVVATHFNIKQSQLKGEKRDRNLALPRQILYYVLNLELKISLVEIGNLLGGRDHTTILHGVRKITNLLSTNEEIRGDILGIKQRLFG